MDEQERLRLMQLLQSVEDEEREEIRANDEIADRLQRLMFDEAQVTENTDSREEAIERNGSEQSEDELQVSEHNSDSEVSMEDIAETRGDLGENMDVQADAEVILSENETNPNAGEPSVNNPTQNYILGKDKKTKWNTHMTDTNLRGRIRRHNIIRAERSGVRLPCPRGEATNVKTPIDAWTLFFPDNLIDKIVEYTNIWIDLNKAEYVRERDAKPTDKIEIKALLGLLYLAGLLKSSHTNLEDLWSSDGFGIEYFRLVMSIKRFKFLLRALRFDDIRTRRQRRQYDKLAPIRDVFEDFVTRCTNYYCHSAFVTLDEMLEPFRGRCSFRQYIPKKPAKYGIKLQALSDARSFYTSKLEVYAGKQQEGPYRVSNSALDVTLRMISHISGSGRHLTLDNWYGSIPLAKQLVTNHRLTVTCTLRKDKPEIPPCFIDSKIRQEKSSLFGYQDDVTLLSYCPTKKKCVILASTFHHTDEIDESTGDKLKPFLLTCYNKYKGGVDTVDHMKAAYSVARKTNRWPLTLFFTLMNIGGINAYVILQSNVADLANRRSFLKDITKALCVEHMNRRASLPMLPTTLRARMRELGGQPLQPVENPDGQAFQRTGRCRLCGRKKNRKSSAKCSQCRYFMCREHTTFTCVECAGQVQQDSSSDD